MAKKKSQTLGVPDITMIDGIDEPKKPQKLTAKEEKRLLERELRRYVCRRGGFRKNLPPADKKRAERIMEKLDRKEPKWDSDIVFPDGIDKPTVAGIVFAD